MDKIVFTVNGDEYTLSGSEVSPETTLNEFLRDHLHLFGTKAMCHEGGCGACVVAVAHTHPVSKEKEIFSVNSCLVHVLSCHQWEITTIEGLGNRRVGYHPLQARLAAFNGTQCGYCSPGWVMGMYSLYERAGRKLSAAEVERSFGGHVCRCTGYRPILDAFKSFAGDADPGLAARAARAPGLPDVEDLSRGCAPGDWCVIGAGAAAAAAAGVVALRGDRHRWYKAYTVKDVFTILAREGTSDCMLVAGNTGKGVFWTGAARVQVDIASVEELRECRRDANLCLGAAASLTEMMDQCKKWQTDSDFRYLEEFHQHLDLVAHVSVRNIGTIGGNLAMKNKHPEFPSDVFLLLDTVQATITVVNSLLEKKELSPADFLLEDLTGKLISKVELPPLGADNLVRTYKVMARAQNAVAVVNAGFLFRVDGAGEVRAATLAFGNICAGLQRARRAEEALRGRRLCADDALQAALRALAAELAPARGRLRVSDANLGPQVRLDVTVQRQRRGLDVRHELAGSFNMGAQYHYSLETQSCHCEPTERGLRLRSATQWPDRVQQAVAGVLRLRAADVQVETRHVGGAYGGKASRSALAACACALAAARLGRPARLALPLRDGLRALGKRGEFEATYSLGADAAGRLQRLDVEYYCDCGCSFNESPVGAVKMIVVLRSLYASDTFQLKGYSVRTDKPSNTWCRAPGTAEGTALMEHIMERIALATGRDPFEVRLANLAPAHDDMRDVVAAFRRDCDFDRRLLAVDRFNADNAWRKRALKATLMWYPVDAAGPFNVVVAAYHGDGSVALAHAGIEMGQGINTKAAQVCAHELGVPLDTVSVRGTDTFTSPNAMVTSGSSTSETVAFATMQACKELKRRLDPFRKDGMTWKCVVKEAYKAGVDLQASYTTHPSVDKLKPYSVYGACCLEVELDVLTGQHVVRRADIFEDTGFSLNPDIDVGQVEGAFVMGLGLWTSEHLVHEPASGRLLTDSSWLYKPPGAQDIPRDLRVAFRRNSRNAAGVLGSKATGEPALVLAVAVALALHHTILEARKEFGYVDDEWLHIQSPYTLETILNAISPKTEYFKLK
ncbi:indole-3-acetaldehyde oxidase-like [Hyposmocoma kahamanoa]|uniref:indole-3-acetaldehyde oxidase-like n=1 Tax=Hyposmocoma kahamanoa TaxID=1477025 RepID=UPI000E6D8F8D|nr:indole-3-acetaldehyde oxidase-like [Hyposmocoma kahamanoa]